MVIERVLNVELGPKRRGVVGGRFAVPRVAPDGLETTNVPQEARVVLLEG